MKYFITGGCGFIGSHLVERLLLDGHEVVVLDDLSTGRRENLAPGAQLVVGDVSDAALVAKAAEGADVLFHLAAIASVPICEQEPERAERTNVGGLRAVLAAAQTGKRPVIYASSAAVYGDNPNLPLGETETPAPLNAYGRHKLTNEQDATAAWAAHGVTSVGLRFFNVYGPRQDPRSPYSGVISKFVACALADQPIPIFGDGEQTRDFIFVGDIVNLLVLAAQQIDGDALIFNGCTGRSINLKLLAEGLGLLMDRPTRVEHLPPRGGDIRHSLGDPGAAQDVLAFNAWVELPTGLATLIDAGGDA